MKCHEWELACAQSEAFPTVSSRPLDQVITKLQETAKSD
jgi:hypothetical protein